MGSSVQSDSCVAPDCVNPGSIVSTGAVYVDCASVGMLADAMGGVFAPEDAQHLFVVYTASQQGAPFLASPVEQHPSHS